jgi:hypothetical protein
VQYTGGELKLGINPDYLDQFLSAVEGQKCLTEGRTRSASVPVGRRQAFSV